MDLSTFFRPSNYQRTIFNSRKNRTNIMTTITSEKGSKIFLDSKAENTKRYTKSTRMRIPWSMIRQGQQAHPLPWDCDEGALDVDFRLTSTMSSCFVEESVSIPGNAAAIFRNRAYKIHDNFCQRKGKIAVVWWPLSSTNSSNTSPKGKLAY